MEFSFTLENDNTLNFMVNQLDSYIPFFFKQETPERNLMVPCATNVCLSCTILKEATHG